MHGHRATGRLVARRTRTGVSTPGCSRRASTRGNADPGDRRVVGLVGLVDAARRAVRRVAATAARAPIAVARAPEARGRPRSDLVPTSHVAAWIVGAGRRRRLGGARGDAGALAATVAVARVARDGDRGRRTRAADERCKQLAEAVSLVASAMRSGRSLHQAIELAATDLDPLLGSTFRRLADRTGLGDPMDESIDAWAGDVRRSRRAARRGRAQAPSADGRLARRELGEPRADPPRSPGIRSRAPIAHRAGEAVGNDPRVAPDRVLPVPVGDRSSRSRGRVSRRRPGSRRSARASRLQGAAYVWIRHFLRVEAVTATLASALAAPRTACSRSRRSARAGRRSAGVERGRPTRAPRSRNVARRVGALADRSDGIGVSTRRRPTRLGRSGPMDRPTRSWRRRRSSRRRRCLAGSAVAVAGARCSPRGADRGWRVPDLVARPARPPDGRGGRPRDPGAPGPAGGRDLGGAPAAARVPSGRGGRHGSARRRARARCSMPATSAVGGATS